jgi:uncharacterized protein
LTDYIPITDQTPLPKPQQARAWWDDFKMLDNIREHSEVVTQVALAITDWLAHAGVCLNREAVEVGALLHDIAKTPCLGTAKLHAQEGGEIMQRLGYPELAYLVANHVYLTEDHPLDETMVVNYADKRVTHNEIVDLDARFEYIAERYGLGDPERLARIQTGLKYARRAENMIFSPLAPQHTPDDIMLLKGGS